MARKLERPAPPYRQIAGEIRDQIRSGRLKPGDRVPSVRAILREYGVAMATAQRALSALRAEGYIRPERGIGNVVTGDEDWGRAASEWVVRSRKLGRVYPEGHYARIGEVGIEKASDQVAGALGVKVGAPVVRRDRITYNGNQPISASTSWFDGALAEKAPKLLTRERVREGTFAYVASALGRTVASWQDQYDPALATRIDAERLEIPEGSAVVHGRNWVYADTGEVLEYGESVSAGRITYRGELTG